MPHIGTITPYLGLRKLKTEVIMWIAVIISVFLSVEVLSYISGGGWKEESARKESAVK